MPRIVTKEKIHTFKIQDKFYNIFIMKKYFKFLLVLLTIVFFNKYAFSCDALNVKIGSGISQASEVFPFLEDHEEVYPEETNVVRYDSATFVYCPNSNLDKISAVSFRTTIVCSKCAEKLPSAVVIVQPSACS